MNTPDTQTHSLNRWLYVGLPAIMLALPYSLNAFFPAQAEWYFAKENGLVENLTVALLFFALVAAVAFIRYAISSLRNNPVYRFCMVWLALYTLGCVYFLGEEISWGQHLFDWTTPESWQQVNDQHETNLHNTSAIFDQIPRAMMTLGIIIGGLVLPLTLKRNNDEQPKDVIDFALPTTTCVPAAFAVFFVGIHDKIYDLVGVEIPQALDIKDGEVKEALIAVFILIYIMALRNRMRE